MMQTQLFNDRTYIYLDGGLVEGGGVLIYGWLKKRPSRYQKEKWSSKSCLISNLWCIFFYFKYFIFFLLTDYQ